MVKKVWNLLSEGGWALLVLLLPLTSLPLLAKLVHSPSVAAPSGVVLLIAVIFGYLPYLWRGGVLPRQSMPLLIFIAITLAACLAAFFIDLPPFKAVSIYRNELEGLLTLAVGVSFYLVVATYPASPERMRKTLLWLNFSGLILILWSLTQVATWYLFNRYPAWIRTLQDLISLGPLYRQRPAGFTLEPSWLAHQLNMLYLPIWLAATIKRKTAFSRRILGVSGENLLLIGGAAVLFLTYSRVGLLAFLLMIAFLLIRANFWLIKRLENRAQRLRKVSVRKKYALRVGLFAGLLVFYLIALLGLGYGLSRVDVRMKNLFQFSSGVDNPILTYTRDLNFASRVVYWQAGWGVFNQYPWLGVGLGNAGYFFPQTMSSFGWGLFEVRNLMYSAPDLPNIKSLWVRLLAETGLIGFGCFVIWLNLHWMTGRELEKQKTRYGPWLGMAGQFVLIGLLLEGFSVDSFALPYFWVTLGLVAAADRLGKIGENKLL